MSCNFSGKTFRKMERFEWMSTPEFSFGELQDIAEACKGLNETTYYKLRRTLGTIHVKNQQRSRFRKREREQQEVAQ